MCVIKELLTMGYVLFVYFHFDHRRYVVVGRYGFIDHGQYVL